LNEVARYFAQKFIHLILVQARKLRIDACKSTPIYRIQLFGCSQVMQGLNKR